MNSGYNVSNLNRGMMKQMQSEPSNTTSDCYISTTDTNAELLRLADFPEYVLGGFDAATFAEMFKVMNIKYM